MIEQLGNCSFYLNSSRLFDDDSLSKNVYYKHYVRRMKAEKKFWFMWKNESRSILIIQVFYSIKFKKIFKDLKREKFKRDKFWLGMMQLMNNVTLEEGFYSLYHTNDLKSGVLNISGTIKMQVFYEEISLFIPIRDGVGNHLLVGNSQLPGCRQLSLEGQRSKDTSQKIYRA
jgi:hypothetical protein